MSVQAGNAVLSDCLEVMASEFSEHRIELASRDWKPHSPEGAAGLSEGGARSLRVAVLVFDGHL